MARAKSRARKVTRASIRSRYPNLINSKDTAGAARSGDTSVPTAGNAKSKGGAAAASAGIDGDVAAVMEVDDAVTGTEDDETSTAWCFAVTSLCAAVGSTGSLLLGCGSGEHLCTPKFADLIPTGRDRSPLKLKDVQQNDLAISGQKTVPVLVGPTGGKHAMEATATFRVAEVRDNISFTLGPRGCSMEKDGRRVPLYLMCWSVRRDLDTWRREQLLRMRSWMVWTSTSLTRRADPAVEPSAEAGTTPAPVLKNVVEHQRVTFQVA